VPGSRCQGSGGALTPAATPPDPWTLGVGGWTLERKSSGGQSRARRTPRDQRHAARHASPDRTQRPTTNVQRPTANGEAPGPSKFYWALVVGRWLLGVEIASLPFWPFALTAELSAPAAQGLRVPHKIEHSKFGTSWQFRTRPALSFSARRPLRLAGAGTQLVRQPEQRRAWHRGHGTAVGAQRGLRKRQALPPQQPRTDAKNGQVHDGMAQVARPARS
jgi:hypothetical protein